MCSLLYCGKDNQANSESITQNILPDHMKSLPEALSRIYAASGKKFVIIIDEWDVLIRDDGSEPEDSGGLY